ncbi:hypothetical protein HPB51_017767 [Rhipicephalus microplus]|uniref:Uncharacterized protein n=1 Tax=Rhipicephalus microplus TaxID=6941 RepID=A0A9J6EAZ2_RHIMP|nr:hypothetical protein HPB51_017767 [Rhipicephalus microplus]
MEVRLLCDELPKILRRRRRRDGAFRTQRQPGKALMVKPYLPKLHRVHMLVEPEMGTMTRPPHGTRTSSNPLGHRPRRREVDRVDVMDDDNSNDNNDNSCVVVCSAHVLTQRPIPPDTIVCTYGPGITASSPFPVDGVCDFIVLEQMPSSTPGDFGGPWPTGVQHFVDTAAQYSKTEFVAAFDYETIRMPDMYISKAHLYEDDSIYKECKILPPNLLKEPHDMTEHHVYFYDLYSALKHASDIDKFRDQGMKTTALSVSVGVYGRWYNVKGLKDEDKFSPGEGCFQRFIKEQMASIATVCEGWKYEIAKSESYSCEYAMDPNTTRTFAYDTPKTLNYKLCMSKKNVTSLQYGFTVARLEYSDVSNVCGLGKFPLLTTVKKTLTFLKNYKSADDFEECLKYQANRRTGEKRATLDDE